MSIQVVHSPCGSMRSRKRTPSSTSSASAALARIHVSRNEVAAGIAEDEPAIVVRMIESGESTYTVADAGTRKNCAQK
jgi:hypothetical protein